MGRRYLKMKVSRECRYFEGDKPCIFHKQEGAICRCRYYQPINYRILIIKSGRIGDVIRTTPILRKLKQEHPNACITWMTDFPEVLPDLVDNPLEFKAKNILILQAGQFDLLLNFDKELESCALTKMIKADKKKGFTIIDGKCAPIDGDSIFKFQTGIDDGLNKRCKKSYPEQVFDMAGYQFNKERYILDCRFDKHKKLIGFNAGAGERWPNRLWSEDKWIGLAKRLKAAGYEVMLLGGESEHNKNLRIAQIAEVVYFGHHSLKTFIALVNLCDLIVTGVTMTLHIAIALEKKIVLLNNIFNKAEFELYGLGKILEPKVTCVGCYRLNCERNCIEMIRIEDVLEAVRKLMKNED